ncbi:glomulin-like isoform X1 [Ruditapes philippinarum]|uniref:glomulin-like isoform X1 n=1 Tax=Ruditapes philippinarum TaxID=129788 RepID=UPI00295B1D00|nr:glomulin-like isoform X1 [Ruditapes philippinarum]
MEMEMIVESVADRMNLIRECVSYKDPVGVKKLILEDKFNEESEHWELISILGECITQENFDTCPGFVTVCERCMKYVLNVGKPKELLLALLEQADSFSDSVKFSTFLGLLEMVILKLETNQFYSLELALETLSDCIRNLELPKSLDLEGEERRAPDLDPVVDKINTDVAEYLNFLSKFVNCLTVSGCKESELQKKKNTLVKYLLRVLEHPLVFLDLQAKEVNGRTVKSGSVNCMERLMGLLTSLHPRFTELIDDSLSHNKRLDRRKRIKLDTSEDVSFEEEPVSMMALSCLSYLMFVEGYGQHETSCLITKQGIMESNLKFVVALMRKEESEVRLKGVLLFQHLLGILNEGTVLSYEDLDRPEYFQILDALFDIMIRCPVKDIRQLCVQIVPGFIQLFDSRARYQISLKLFGTLKHAGAFGFCVQLFKNQMEEIIADPWTGSKDSHIFCGINLKRVFLLMTSLPEGPATDLVENSDRIIAVLNFIRYLVLKDPPKTNLTGFWDFYPHIEKEFLKPLHLGLDMSKGHYQLEITGLEEGSQSKKSLEEQVEMSISVAGFKMPKMARGQKIAIMRMALNTLDLITSLLVRVNELVDQQKKSADK